MNSKLCSSQQSSAGPKPKDMLAKAESLVVAVRRHLRAIARGWFSRTGGSTDDAEALAILIEHLAVKGQKCTAAEAIEIADVVEVLCLELEGEIDALLTSGNRQDG